MSHSLQHVLVKAKDDALAGGLPGMAAMSVQVLTLMWLRTTVNYQYRHGTNTTTALKTLYAQGGIPRFYRGLGPALLQGPLSRFGDTAANAGTLSLLNSLDSTKDMPLMFKTLAASISAATFRIFLMPIDTLKTSWQVDGNLGTLRTKLRTQGLPALYHGSVAASLATFVGHYPWFLTYNYLSALIPESKDMTSKLMRSAFIGFSASLVSDCCANSMRVIKTTRQTTHGTYGDIIRSIIRKEGIIGLMGRGLATKIVTNGIQGLMFSVAWKMAQEQYQNAKSL